MKEFILASLFYLPAGAIDNVSTHYALTHCPNCSEGNPIMARGAIPLKAGMSLGFAAIDSKSSKKTKIAMRITYLTLNIGFSIWNIHQARKYGKI